MTKAATRLTMVGTPSAVTLGRNDATRRHPVYRPSSRSRTEKYTESGVSVWYVKQAILDDARVNFDLAQVLATAAGISGHVAEYLSAETFGPQREATVDLRMKNRCLARVGLSVTISDRYYLEKVLQLRDQHSARLLADPLPRQAGWLFIAASIFFEKVVKGRPANTCTFEQLQAVARKELASTLYEAVMRAEDTLSNVGKPPHPLWHLFASQ